MMSSKESSIFRIFFKNISKTYFSSNAQFFSIFFIFLAGGAYQSYLLTSLRKTVENVLL